MVRRACRAPGPLRLRPVTPRTRVLASHFRCGSRCNSHTCPCLALPLRLTIWQPRQCLADAVSTLVCLVSEIKAIDFENFQAVLNLSLATASVLASGPVPRPSVSAEDAVSALGALSELHALVLSVGGGDPSVGDEAGSQHWAAAWQPLLQALASLCNSADRSVRQAALTSLQRSLLLPDLEQMQPVEWKACMDNVLFPLLNRLLEAGQIPAGAAEETRMRAW